MADRPNTLADMLANGDFTTSDVINRLAVPDPLQNPRGYIGDYLRRQGKEPSPDLANALAKEPPKQEPNWLGKAMEYVPPEAMFAANFIAPNVRLPVPRVANPIKAYHGSPHDFDKFDLSKIGTGEGAQAYGHGLYFAEKEGVAKQYRDKLGGGELTVGGEPVRPGSPYWNAASELANVHAGNIDAMIADRAANPMRALDASGRKSALELLLEEMKAKGVNYSPNGRMYEVALHASPEQFLDWDKPLSGQGEAIRKAVAARDMAAVQNFDRRDIPGWGAGQPSIIGDVDALRTRKRQLLSQREMTRAEADELSELTRRIDASDPSGARVYGSLSGLHENDSGLFGSRGNQAGATQALSEAGIPGIKYLDQGSRQAGQGTNNYVVWTPEIIEILKKYGIAAPIAGAPTLANVLSGDGEQ